MAIQTIDQLVAGLEASPEPLPLMKTGITMAAVGAQRGYTLWYANGCPGKATGNTANSDASIQVTVVADLIKIGR